MMDIRETGVNVKSLLQWRAAAATTPHGAGEGEGGAGKGDHPGDGHQGDGGKREESAAAKGRRCHHALRGGGGGGRGRGGGITPVMDIRVNGGEMFFQLTGRLYFTAQYCVSFWCSIIMCGRL